MQSHRQTPRSHRFVLGERIERNLYDLLEILIRAKYTKHRQELLDQTNLVLEILRLGAARQGLAMPQGRALRLPAKAIDEIGGWRLAQDQWRTTKRHGNVKIKKLE